MGRCISEDCEAEALDRSNYCSTHEQKRKFMARLDESISIFSEHSSGYDAGRESPPEDSGKDE
jgi:hypothetical protein